MDNRLNLLIVDDDEIDRLAVKRSLKKFGKEITFDEAPNEFNALEKLAKNRYDCILLDYRLNGSDGLFFIKKNTE